MLSQSCSFEYYAVIQRQFARCWVDTGVSVTQCQCGLRCYVLDYRQYEKYRTKGTNFSRQVSVANNFVRWHLISVAPEGGTCLICPFWSLEFWRVTYIVWEFVNLCTSVRCLKSFSALTQSFSYRCSMHDLWHCKPLQLRFLVGILQ